MNTITLNNVWELKDMVKQLSFLNTLNKGDTANIKFDLNVKVIMPQYLALIVSAINEARARGVRINIHTDKKCYNSYASRIDFYKHLDVKRTEGFFRRNSEGEFIEITQMDVNCDSINDVKLVNKVMKIFESHYNVEYTVLQTLNFCLWEIIDNIKNHSNGQNKYTFVAQYYKKKQEIRICVCDNGIGIHNALTKTEGSNYIHLSPKESIIKCTDKNVTDGKGRGYGLYSYKNFVKENKGHLVIYSGNYFQDVHGSETMIGRGEYWQGTIIYNKVKTKNKVSIEQIFDNSIPSTVSEYKESVNSLW